MPTNNPLKNGLEACDLLRKCLERVEVKGEKTVKELALSFEFVKSLKKAYADESKKAETKPAESTESKGTTEKDGHILPG